MKHFKKITFRKFFIALGLFIFVGVVGYIAFDWSNIQIDRYNFEQLERVRGILRNTQPKELNFNNLSEFNKDYSTDIKTVENCFYIKDTNRFLNYPKGGEGYVFGFQLKSLLYKILNFKEYYIYPRYNLPKNIGYAGGPATDTTYNYFRYVISHPCED